MSSVELRTRIWDRMVDSERMSRYYTRRSEAFGRQQMGLSFMIAILIILVT